MVARDGDRTADAGLFRAGLYGLSTAVQHLDAEDVSSSPRERD
jgi:hypothetical protein